MRSGQVHAEDPGDDATQLWVSQTVLQALRLPNLWLIMFRIIVQLLKLLLNVIFMSLSFFEEDFKEKKPRRTISQPMLLLTVHYIRLL